MNGKYIATSRTNVSRTKTKANGANPVEIKIPIGPGTVHGMVYIILFMPSTLTKNLNKQTFTIGVAKNGMKNMGFMIIGIPNKTGSLTPKVHGTKAALPTAFNCADRAANSMMKATTNVDPVPPKFMT